MMLRRPVEPKQYAAEDYRAELAHCCLRGSMGRRGNPLRQRQGRELHEVAQGRGGLPDGSTRPSPASGPHCRALSTRSTTPNAAFRPRISQPSQIRPGARPADGQISSLTLSARSSELHYRRAILTRSGYGYSAGQEQSCAAKAAA